MFELAQRDVRGSDGELFRPEPVAAGARGGRVLAECAVPVTQLSTAWWWVGVHGGAGETTLEQLYVGTRAAAHRWPLSPGRTHAVVLVARTNARGLVAVQATLRELSERAVAVHLLGLVLMADAPGRLPRGLRELGERVAAAVPRAWWFPWVAAWREGETPSRANSPKQAHRLLEQLAGARDDREAGS